MQTLDLNDIQGMVLRGYGNLPNGLFLTLSFSSTDTPNQWLQDILPDITFAAHRPRDSAVQVGFTASGLSRLGLSDDDLNGFSLEFRGGMIQPWKSRFLGDYGASAPEHWLWGGPTTPTLDAILLLYALSPETLAAVEKKQAAAASRRSITIGLRLPTLRLPNHREHFGFHDGLSQPRILGYHRSDVPNNLIAPGEFLLGYSNEYDAWPLSPAVDAPPAALPRHPENPGLGDLGANGSYLVFRQLEQDVSAFWKFVKDNAHSLADSSTTEDPVKLAAKMVGRWPSGTPLVLCPMRDDPNQITNDFSYDQDPNGFRCPTGSHIRRSNPRGALRPDAGSASAIRLARRRRILRRGRPYGEPLAASMRPEDLMAAASDDSPRGLHFICLNANIRRQFEFIQQTWVNNPRFNGLLNDPDPLLGNVDSEETPATRMFTMQGSPVRRRIVGVPQFVKVRGGAYLFLPGHRAIAWLASVRRRQ
jgi:Dyp-type peroxidase family